MVDPETSGNVVALDTSDLQAYNLAIEGMAQMPSVTVELTNETQSIARQIQSVTGAESISDVVNQLLLSKRMLDFDSDTLAKLIQEGLDSGEPIEMTDEEWDRLWAEADRMASSAKP
jgi:hypothetical protein